jgi:HAMP domain-containing protein
VQDERVPPAVLVAVLLVAAGAALLALLLLRLRAPLGRMVQERSDLQRTVALGASALRRLAEARRPVGRRSGRGGAGAGRGVDSAGT